ncbi:hypothetical protein [Lutibacter sp. TH_r2]|uniref:hypothetical protein n=1 Tax=Lutibacter sp. TH_r2 TaxID=3082083 RepID=UPI0029531FF4|nr:hypothetical protein [Lutibacter sp. TH_r2]
MFISAFYGFLMRWNFSFPIKNFDYKNILQSHSHVAFLGWGYLGVLILIIRFFVDVKQWKSKIYLFTLLVMLLCIVLMLFSFPLVGYKAFSIIVLSVFGITSYGISFKLLKDIKEISYSSKLVRFGIYYYLLSSLATWFLAYVIVTQGKTELYYNTVYFYLHFLYNGFFVFALFGLFLKLLENKKISISNKHQKYFFIFLNLACIPAYFLSVLWSDVSIMFNVLGGLAALFQIISLLYLIKLVGKFLTVKTLSKVSKALFLFSIASYSLKLSIQFFSAFPYFVTKSIALKPFLIIGYLHLFTLGFMTVFIFFLLNESNIIKLKSIYSKIGVYLTLIGVLVTELLMFSQGFLLMINQGIIQNYHLNLLIASVILMVGIFLVATVQIFRK